MGSKTTTFASPPHPHSPYREDIARVTLEFIIPTHHTKFPIPRIMSGHDASWLMSTHDGAWVFMIFHEYSWCTMNKMEIHGDPWIKMGIFGGIQTY
jgi:hypothetical protein